MNKLREIFNPDPDSESMRNIKRLVAEAVNNMWCITCKNRIDIPSDTPGCCSAYLLCKFGNDTIKQGEACDLYEADMDQINDLKELTR